MKQTRKQIVAMGGGGFLMEPDNPLLDRYVLSLTEKARPKICFIGTAGGDAQGQIDRFYAAFGKLPSEPFHCSLFRGTQRDLRSFILGMDVLYVGGGNTRNLLLLWREWGLEQIVRDAWNNGIVLAGVSAGSICWFEQGITDSIPGKLTPLQCLGILKGTNCPHYDGESERRPAFHQLLQDGQVGPGIAADDGVGLHYIDDRLHRVITSRPDATAYQVVLDGELPRESYVEADYLGGTELLIRRAALRDAEGIHEAHMRSIRENCAKDYSEAQINAWGGRPYDEQSRIKTITQDCVWVVEDLGAIQGFGHLMRRADHPETAEVMGLYLTPNVKGKGLGKRVLQLMEEWSLENGFRRLQLGSTITSFPFYQSQGFVESGPCASMKIGGVEISYLPMSKELA